MGIPQKGREWQKAKGAKCCPKNLWKKAKFSGIPWAAKYPKISATMPLGSKPLGSKAAERVTKAESTPYPEGLHCKAPERYQGHPRGGCGNLRHWVGWEETGSGSTTQILTSTPDLKVKHIRVGGH